MHLRSCSALLVIGLLGCGGFTDEGDEATETPGNPQRPGASDDPTQSPPPLEQAPTPDELTEKYGVFVAPNGSDAGDGSRARPFATITAAITRVKESRLRVYVCAGVYKESVTMVTGVSMVGALACDGGNWRTSAQRARIEAPTSPALQARDIVHGTRLDGFEVVAPAGTLEAPSSIAFIAERATKLVIAGTKLQADKGADGADGAEGIALTLGAAAKGTDGETYVGPFTPIGELVVILHPQGKAGGVGSCIGAPGHDGANGGKGGNAAAQVCSSQAWEVYVDRFGKRYDRSDAVPLSGAAGAAGPDGASASAIGTLSAEGYVPSAGVAGGEGQPGQGGSGGHGGGYFTYACTQGSYIYGVTGPGGGAGGCPGLAGAPGEGGGSSIAALVVASAGISFKASELVAADGGKGGQGAFGSLPTEGGAPGATRNSSPPGASGGAGGRAGFSGSGAGGPSFALAHSGGEPVIAPDTRTKAGAPGAGAAERTRIDAFGNTVTIPASAAGASESVHGF